MPDNYAHVRPGQQFQVPSAQTWNAMLDAAKDAERNKLNTHSDPSSRDRNTGIILVKNQSGRALLRTSVLGLDAPIFLPSPKIGAFLQDISFRTTVPTSAHLGKFCILIDPLEIGKIGRARVSDLAQVKVDVKHAADTCCDIREGDTSQLVSMKSGGSAQLLWKEHEETGQLGTQWAIVRLGTNCRVCCNSSSSSSSSSTSGHQCPTSECKSCSPLLTDCVWHAVVSGASGVGNGPGVGTVSCVCFNAHYTFHHVSGCTWTSDIGDRSTQPVFECGDPDTDLNCATGMVSISGSGVFQAQFIDCVGNSILFVQDPTHAPFDCHTTTGALICGSTSPGCTDCLQGAHPGLTWEF